MTELAAPSAPSRPKPSRLPLWVEVIVLGVLYEGFETLRSHIHPAAGPSIRHALWIRDLERWTWTLHEPVINHWVYAHKTIAQAMNIYYGTVHFVVPPALLLWLWFRHPEQYRRWRNTIGALTVLSLAVFALWPAAPPRFTPSAPHARFDNTDRFGGLGPLDQGNLKDTNPYAAMPSLHVAYSTWCACVVAVAARRRRRWLAVLYPALTFTVVMGTGNHWFLDGVGGWAVLLAGWACAVWWERRKVVQTEVPGSEEVRTHGERGTPQ